MKLNYIFSAMTEPVECSFDEKLDHTWHWLHAVVRENPEINFFFTVETTDIFEPEFDIEYNKVAMMPMCMCPGAPYHRNYCPQSENYKPPVPNGIYWSTARDAMIGPFEPETPCRQFETRPCVELSMDEGQRYRVVQCAPGGCRRFPNRDQREQRGESTQPSEASGAPD